MPPQNFAAAPEPASLAAPDGIINRVFRACAAHWIVVIAAGGLLLYLPFVDLRAIHLEEGRRAIQSIAILDGGSWWLLDIAGQRYVHKPPLLPWLITPLSYVTGGVNAWALRLPSVIFAVAAALAAGGIARLLLIDRDRATRDLAAFAAGVALLCCPLIIEKARIGETDVTATGSVALAFLAFAYGFVRDRLTIWCWLGVAAGLAAAAFAKGPVPVAFAAIPILAATFASRSFLQMAVAIAAIALAFFPLGVWAYLNTFGAESGTWLWETGVTKGTRLKSLEGLLPLIHLNKVPAWLLATMPWVVFAAAYIRHDLAALKRNSLLRTVLIYACAASLVVLLWPGAKVRYALPAVVPVAALAGAAVAVFWDRRLVRQSFAMFGIALALTAMLAHPLLTGLTARHKALHANAAALIDILKDRANGRLLAIDPDVNLLIYAQKPVKAVNITNIKCPIPNDTLIANKDADVARATNGAWKPLGEIGSSGYVAYAPASINAECPAPASR